jgi:hypothetical protein
VALMRRRGAECMDSLSHGSSVRRLTAGWISGVLFPAETWDFILHLHRVQKNCASLSAGSLMPLELMLTLFVFLCRDI